jgi:hypothetical protein
MCIKEKFKRFKSFEKNIVNVVIDNNIITNDLEIVLRNTKYNSTKEPSLWIKHKDEFIKKSNKITYKCSLCDDCNTIGIKRFLTKKSFKCCKCREKCVIKKQNQSKFIKDSFKKYGKVKPKNDIVDKKLKNMTSLEFIEHSNKLFSEEILEFKEKYFNNNISEDDYNKHIHEIHSVNSYQLSKYSDISFIEHIKISHFIKYTTAIYIKDIDKVVNLTNVEYKCESCDSVFRATRKIKEKLTNKKKILCRACGLCNNTFKLRHTENILGNKISYQSQLELSLILHCNKNSIIIEDGITVNYEHESKKKTYRIDFYFPTINKHIEIKDFHIWHQENLLNGKHDAKMVSVQNLNFELVYKKDLNKFIDSLKYQDIV